jgi:hypothetical protein
MIIFRFVEKNRQTKDGSLPIFFIPHKKNVEKNQQNR